MDKKINARELGVLAFVSVLSPIVRMLPETSLRAAGSAAWLSPLPAAALIAGHVLLTLWLFSKRREGEGLYDISLRAFGPLFGRLMPLLAALWLTLYTGIVTRSAAERLVSVVYPGSSPAVFILVTLAAVLAVLYGRSDALYRSAEIVMPLIVGCLIFVFLFSAGDVRLPYLLPVGPGDAVPILRGTVPILEALGLWAFFLFAGGRVTDSPRLKRELLLRMPIAALAAFALIIITAGSLSPELAVRFLSPALTVVRNIRVFGTDARVDAVIVAVWIVTDFALIAAAASLARDIFSSLFPKRKLPFLPVAVAAAAALWAFLLSKTAFGANIWSSGIAPAVNGVFAWILIPLTLAVGAVRRKD